ncbi:UPF0450 protein C17orf58 homolog [Rhinoderma darwinii]|uniref:UPF0450 protein C17orf58 homolog n=1 Tax=Rhinoderma darwinii TaxID=43563 RepID=UPI003F67F481
MRQKGGRGREALQLISTRMLSGAGHALILVIIAATVTDARKDVLDNSTLSPPGETADPPRSQVSPSRLSKPGDEKKTTKTALDNNTGLRKTDVHLSNRLPANDVSGRPAAKQDRDQPDPILVSPIHSKGVPDHQSNRPGKKSPDQTIEPAHNTSKAAWTANRHPAGLLHHLYVFRKEPDNSKDRTCLRECHKERDEREAYCHSDFAVNGIIHDVDTLSAGIRLLTVLVDSGGLYKMNRLYITPDGFFFTVTILLVDNPHCAKPCLHLKLGGRYIIMGQIYHKMMEFPSSVQRVISGRLRAGDGLVTSGRSFVRRFNRKKDRKVLAAAQSKCKERRIFQT